MSLSVRRSPAPWRTLLPSCLLLGASLAAAQEVAPPNVLVILLDDAGYADFGFMGPTDLQTPEIDRLARDGVAFRDFHVTATVCAPSRAGLLSGRYQQRFGFEGNAPPVGQGLDPAAETLADALRGEGYRTMLVGKWHLGLEAAFHPLNRGFDEFYGFLGGSRSYFPSAQDANPRAPQALQENWAHVTFEGYLTDVLTDRAIAYLREPRTEPFFLFMSYNAPHVPMEAKLEHLEKFAGHPRATLAAMMWSVDENIGRLRAELESQGRLDNTLIFFFSDNGGAESNRSSNRPLKGWKGNKFEGGHRVPAIVSWPARLPKGEWHDGLTSSLDVMATAGAAAGRTAPFTPALDGINLLPILEGQTPADPERRLFWRKGSMAAMRAGTDKLIRLDGHGFRFYDLAADGGETADRREADPERYAQLLAGLREWETTLPRPGWYEDEDWASVTWDIHFDLMNNQRVRWKTPYEKRRATP